MALLSGGLMFAKFMFSVLHRCGYDLGEEDIGRRKASVYNVEGSASSGSWWRSDFGMLLKMRPLRRIGFSVKYLLKLSGKGSFVQWIGWFFFAKGLSGRPEKKQLLITSPCR
jgi:hypothetical protein